MMEKYINMMEAMVEDAMDLMGGELGCCMCRQCRNDMAAYALNHLPPKYVVTKAGGAISKADSLRIQHLTDVRTAVLQAAQIVNLHPRH